MPIAFPTIDAGTLLAHGVRCVVDLRSPSEFAEDHVPGAVNVPLFDDVQRALVGTLYARESPEAAFAQARAFVRARIGALVAGIAAATGWQPAAADLERRVDALTGAGFERTSSFLMSAEERPAPPGPVVLHCWRGGLRSRSVLHFVRELGLDSATLLAGGYKAYRAQVASELAAFEPPPACVLRGLTGVGKTLVVRELARMRPELVIDLEGLAGHRGSLLGMVGLEPCSQKTFESRLAARVRAGLGPVLVVEGESRKVGDVILPPRLWEAMERGTNLELHAGVERRVQVLAGDYLSTERSRSELRRQLPLVEARMPRKALGTGLVALLEQDRIDELVRLLLEHYYDPLYRHSQKSKRYAARIDATDPARAAEAVLETLRTSAPARGWTAADPAGRLRGALLIRDLTIVVPAHNEARRIEATVEKILAWSAANLDRLELFVVDDGSTDGTADLVERRFGDRARVLRRPRRGGKGAAVRTGVLAATRPWLLFADADLSIPIEEMEKLGARTGEAPIVIGSKRAPGNDIVYPRVRRWLGSLGGLVVAVLVVPGFHDTQCGFKLYRTDVAQQLFRAARIDGFGFDFEVLYLARRFGHRVVEVPVRVEHQLGSTVRAGSYVQVLREALQVWWNKLRGAYAR